MNKYRTNRTPEDQRTLLYTEKILRMRNDKKKIRFHPEELDLFETILLKMNDETADIIRAGLHGNGSVAEGVLALHDRLSHIQRRVRL